MTSLKKDNKICDFKGDMCFYITIYITYKKYFKKKQIKPS